MISIMCSVLLATDTAFGATNRSSQKDTVASGNGAENKYDDWIEDHDFLYKREKVHSVNEMIGNVDTIRKRIYDKKQKERIARKIEKEKRKAELKRKKEEEKKRKEEERRRKEQQKADAKRQEEHRKKQEAERATEQKQKRMEGKGSADNAGSGVKAINVVATFYTAFCPTGCTGVTATGKDVSKTIYHQGKRIIAVDPNVIPLNTTVNVILQNGDQFEAIALDTGGDIKGNRIDILVESRDEAYKLGRQQATLYIVR